MKYIIKNILREETQKKTLPQVILQDVIKTFTPEHLTSVGRDYQTDKNANKKTLIVLFGEKFGRIEIVSMLLLSYISFFLLSKELNNYNLFYSIIFSIPLALNIIYDIYNLSGEKLNNTLPKIASLLILQCILLGIAIYI